MGFVLDQSIDCHGGGTNVVKNAMNVVKSVVKTDAGGRVGGGSAVEAGAVE